MAILVIRFIRYLSLHLSLDGIRVITNKYGRWRARVEELLVSRWAGAPMNVQELAATIVGMFDAGARESEVAAFLSDRERTQDGAPRLTDDARRELVRDLHMSAGSLHSTQSNEEEFRELEAEENRGPNDDV